MSGTPEATPLRRVLTTGPLILYGLGVIVGAGIYVAVGAVIEMVSLSEALTAIRGISPPNGPLVAPPRNAPPPDPIRVNRPRMSVEWPEYEPERLSGLLLRVDLLERRLLVAGDWPGVVDHLIRAAPPASADLARAA